MSEVKHKMNPISGYYEGDDGVFYDIKHDEIFELEFEGAFVFRFSIGKKVGRYYRHRTPENRKGFHPTALVGMGNVIRLGDL